MVEIVVIESNDRGHRYTIAFSVFFAKFCLQFAGPLYIKVNRPQVHYPEFGSRPYIFQFSAMIHKDFLCQLIPIF